MVRVRYTPNQQALNSYYAHQTGNGYSGVFRGPVYQRGHGLGGLFGRLFRAAVPVFKSTVAPALKRGAKAIAREALRTGVGVATDALDGQNALHSLDKHSRAAAKSLINQGSRKLDAILTNPPPLRRQRRIRAPPKKRRKTIKGSRDIYG